jgi:cytochrome c-type biogenesis protein CcmF
MAILGIFFVITSAAFTMLAIRWPKFASQNNSSPLSREGMLMLNNIFLSVAAATVLIGTLYPLFIQALGRPDITVGPPYYNATFVPLMLPLLVAMALGQGLAWGMGNKEAKKERGQEAKSEAKAGFIMRYVTRKNITIFSLIIIAIAIFYFLASWPFVFLASFLLGALVVLSTAPAWRRMKLSQLVAHIGLGICVMGMAGTLLGGEHMVQVKPGDKFIFAGYTIHYEQPFERAGSNYLEGGALMQVDGVGAMMPSRRYFPVADVWTTEAAIHTTLLGDLFMTVGIPDEQKAVAMRIRFQPLQLWIWLGAALIMLGGLAGAVQVMRRK